MKTLLPRFPLFQNSLLLSVVLAPIASGAIVVTVTENRDGVGTTPNNPQIPLAVSSTDLINTGQTSLGSTSTTGYTAFQTASPAVLNDGADGGWNVTAGNTAVTTQSANWSQTYTLNLAGAAQGYDLTGISVMSLWTNDFVNQRYAVEITTVSVPTFTALMGTDVVATTLTSGGSAGSSLKSSLTENGPGGLLASGVTGIRFTFKTQNDPFGNAHHAAYREIDVFGSATVPEPSASALILVALSFATFRHRRN